MALLWTLVFRRFQKVEKVQKCVALSRYERLTHTHTLQTDHEYWAGEVCFTTESYVLACYFLYKTVERHKCGVFQQFCCLLNTKTTLAKLWSTQAVAPSCMPIGTQFHPLYPYNYNHSQSVAVLFVQTNVCRAIAIVTIINPTRIVYSLIMLNITSRLTVLAWQCFEHRYSGGWKGTRCMALSRYEMLAHTHTHVYKLSIEH